MQHQNKSAPPPAAPPKKKQSMGVVQDLTAPNFKDVYLICREPHKAPFTWDVGQQEFLWNLLKAGKISEIVEPVRCVPCQMKRRANRTN